MLYISVLAITLAIVAGCIAVVMTGHQSRK